MTECPELFEDVKVPTFIIQVHDDPITLPINVQTTYVSSPVNLMLKSASFPIFSTMFYLNTSV
ncbi:MAG: hypothetical protein CSA23_06080 [Deltaproteobacteria bacterium]|nr:MAG: hypothetical protein CSA23_06080 [Deltaproteobacteria bacterium]